MPGTQAADRGIQPGDLITHVKGNVVRSPREFVAAVENAIGQVAIRVLTPSDRNAVDREVVFKAR